MRRSSLSDIIARIQAQAEETPEETTASTGFTLEQLQTRFAQARQAGTLSTADTWRKTLSSIEDSYYDPEKHSV